MPSRASCLLRVGGRLRGDLKANSGIVSEMEKFFATKPVKGLASWEDKPGAPWPDGVVLKEYYVCAWDLKKEEELSQTVIHFRAEVHQILNGSLYGNKDSMIPDVRWFYEGPEYRWHRELRAKLEEWNQTIADANRIEQIWFRDWQWYCGNGGGT
jgi:hypothetical protein